jgi:hypothetical protein
MMDVDPNVTAFVDLVVNDAAFRSAISSGNKQTIMTALADPTRSFTLTPEEVEAAADALYNAGNLGQLSHLEEILSHQPTGTRGN